MTDKTSKFSPHWKSTVLPTSATIRDALVCLNNTGLLICCFLKDNGVLAAILADGDIRRAMINGANLDDPAFKWSNHNPNVVSDAASVAEIRDLAQVGGVYELPLVDGLGRLTDVFVLNITESRITDERLDFVKRSEAIPNAMFILAGGMGSRLRSVISDVPKPLAIVGKKPILATLILRAAAAGIRNFYISVNYMADKVERHLADPMYQDLKIEIIREPKRLGTAGSIGMIADRIAQPMFVCNADVLTTVPYERILRQHQSEGSHLTCVVRPYDITVPFGVVDISENQIVAIKEKPKLNYLVNAGIYVLNPEVCQLVPKNQFFDMPDLFVAVMQKQLRINPFYMHEYWIDVGRPEEYHRANQDYESHFE